MLQLRQLDLEFALAGAGTLGEDIENQGGAIENLALEKLFQIAALRRRKFVVEDDGVDLVLLTPFGEFGGFARPDERGREGRFNFLAAGSHHLSSGGGGEF